MQKINSFSEIAGKYTAILCDLWGVVVNGIELFPKVDECLYKIHDLGIKVYFITNASRQKNALQKTLSDFGLKDYIIEHIISSGDIVRQKISSNKLGDFIKKPNSKCYLIGSLSFFDGMSNVQLADDIETADYVILGDVSPTDADTVFCEQAIKHDIPFVCANPDKGTMHGAKLKRCAGYLADIYEQMGGSVYYYGKPYSPIYDYIVDSYSLHDDRILCIGDSLTTDIQGAINKNFDSLLITNGMFGFENGVDAVEEKCMQQSIVPTYYMDNFVF